MQSLRMRRVLSVGGSSREVPLPAEYAGWESVVLDIDPRRRPDVVCDARQLTSLPRAQYEAVYCSHNLEHYYEHEVPKVIAGFLHVLKPGGFAHIRVPDMKDLMRTVAERDIDIDDVLYESPAGPIRVKDVIYGYSKEIENSGSDFYAHKTGFTRKTLETALHHGGFEFTFVRSTNYELIALAFAEQPDEYAARLFGLPRAP